MPIPLLPTRTLDLTDLSQEGLRERLQYLFNQVRPEWTDFSLAYPENLLLEGMALLVSAGVEHSRELVRQLGWSLVTDRLAAIRLGRSSNFELTGATAPTVTGTFSLPGGAAATKEITIPAGTRASSGSVIYKTTQAATITVGSSSVDVQMECAEAQSETIQSTGESNIHIRLSQAPYVEGSIQVSAANGTYTNLNAKGQKYLSFLEMTPDTRGFILLVDNYGYGHVLFGNSVYGAVPQGAISITYKTGGGRSSAVAAGVSWRILDTILDAGGDSVTLVLTNASAASPGQDQMTVEEARVRGPLAYRTLARVVNEEDAEYAATTVAGIARALCATSEDDSSVQEDEAVVHLVAEGTQYDSGYYAPATPTSGQIADVEALYAEGGAYEALMGVRMDVRAATFRDITVACRIHKDSGYTASQVKANVTANLQDFFAVQDENGVPNMQVDFGCRLLGADGNPDYKIAWSDVFNVINDTAGVREIPPSSQDLLLAGSRNSVTLQPSEFPRLSTVTLYDMDNNGQQM